MPRTKSVTTASTEKIVEAENIVAETKNVDIEKPVTVETTEKTEKSVKPVKINFGDTDIVKIFSKERAGKSITSNTLDVITFDEKGYAECKGINAKYLLESGLGFELAK